MKFSKMILSRSNKLTSWNYLLLLVICTLSFYQYINYTVLLNDGARWYMDLKVGEPFLYDGFHRFSTLIWHLLTHSLSSLFDGDMRVIIMDFLFRFFYTFHPLIFIAISYRILSRTSEANLICLPSLTYLMITLPAMSFPCSSAVEAANYFWPLFFLGRLKRFKWYDYCFFFLFYIFMTFTYLQAILLSFTLLVQEYLKCKNYKSARSKLVVLLFIIPFTFFIYKTFFFLSPEKGAILLKEFQTLFKMKYIFIFFPGIISILYILYFEKLRKSHLRYMLSFFSVSFSFLAFYFLSNLTGDRLVLSGFAFRLIIIPFTFVFSIISLYYLKNKKHIRIDNTLKLLIALPIICGCILNLRTSFLYGKGISNLKRALENSKSNCTTINPSEFHENFTQYGILPDFVPLLSFIINKTSTLDKVIFSQVYGFWEPVKYPHLSQCNSVLTGKIPVYINPVNNLYIFQTSNLARVNYKIYNELKANRYVKTTKVPVSDVMENFIAFDRNFNTAKFHLNLDSKKIMLRLISNLKPLVYLYNDVGDKIKLSVVDEIIQVSNLKSGNYEIKIIAENINENYPLLSPMQVTLE